MHCIKKRTNPNIYHFFLNYTLPFFIVLIIANCKVYSQNYQIPDSLKQKPYKELNKGYINSVNDSIKRINYATIYLRKAKKEKDTIRIAKAYSLFASNSTPKTALKYCDSIIDLTINLNHNEYPGFGYLSKGMCHYNLGNDQKALDNYLIAQKFAKKYKNINLSLYIQSLIGKIKNFTGKNEEALKSFKIILNSLEKEKKITEFNQLYLATIFSISNSYMFAKKYDSARIYSKKGLLKSLIQKDSHHYYNFVSQTGYIAYYQNNFKKAIDSLDKALPHETTSNGFLNDHYYRGKIYCKLKNEAKAFYHFKKADSIYNSTNDAVYEVREIQEFFVSYYKKKKDLESELFYINRLLKVDSIMTSKNHYLNDNITKRYDVPNLISEKEKIISSLKNEEKNSNVLISSLFIVIALSIPVIFTFYKKQKKYKYELNQIDLIRAKKVSKKTNSDLNGISPKIIESVLIALEGFEKNNGFLENKITLNILSKQLNTNSNYLSKIINTHKKMNFSSYLSSLRIDYCIEKLKTDSKFRKFTVNGIAFEIGFNNVESFSKAFHKKTKVHPSSFIKEIEEKNT